MDERDERGDQPEPRGAGPAAADGVCYGVTRAAGNPCRPEQYFTQANDLATQYGQYYQPGMPGQAGVAGVNNPQAGQTTLAGQQQAYSQQMGVINAAAGLQANPFRQAQVLGQAGRVLQGMPTAAFQAPNTVTGVGTAGGNTQGGMGYLQQMIDDIRDPSANQTTAQSWLDSTPTPNKLDSQSFLSSSADDAEPDPSVDAGEVRHRSD